MHRFYTDRTNDCCSLKFENKGSGRTRSKRLHQAQQNAPQHHSAEQRRGFEAFVGGTDNISVIKPLNYHLSAPLGLKQYEIMKNAGLDEVEINGRKCLIKENIDLDYTDEDGVSNRE